VSKIVNVVMPERYYAPAMPRNVHKW
jgi:hypothetical protein